MTNKNSFNSLILGFCFFTVAFLISRAQFFACPTVEIQNDSGEYLYWIDAYIAKGEMPPINYIPIGYPLITKFLTLIHDSVYPIVYFQITLTFLSFFFLVYTLWSFYDKKIYYLTLFLACIYVQVPNNLFWDIYLMSESLYNSSLVLLAAAMVCFIHSPTKKSSTFFSLALALPVLFRPTGIFALIIFLFISGYILYKKQKELLLPFILPFTTIYLFLSVYSLIVSDEANFIAQRIADEYAPYTPQSKKDLISFITNKNTTKFNKTVTQYLNFTKQSQIYTRIDEANQKYFLRNFAHTNEWQCCYFGWIDSTMQKERKAVFKEFYNTDKMKYLISRETQFKKTFFFKLYDLFQLHFIKKIILRSFWILLMFVSFIFSACLFICSGFENKKALLLVLIIAINIGTMGVVIAANHMPMPRYSYPGEFIFLLQLPFLINLLSERINAIK